MTARRGGRRARGAGGRAPGAARAERGLALMLVIVVLAGLAVIAVPFALSMRGLEAAALHGFEQQACRADLALAMQAARRQLEETHPLLDERTPFSDGPAEISPPDLASRQAGLLPRDPRGTIASVRIADERGKVHLGSASVWLLGNLLGGRTRLVEPATASDATLAVASTAGFPAAGLLWAGREVIETSAREPGAFLECRRGAASTALPVSIARPHEPGQELLDLRLLLLAQHGWSVRPGAFEGFRRVDGLREIALYGELGYSSEELERVRPWLSVHAGALDWRDEQRVLGLATGRDGGPELRVRDGSRCGAGSVLELRAGDGRAEWNLVLSAVEWDGEWRLALLLPPSLPLEGGEARVACLAPAPVNVGTCAPEVLEALLAGVRLSPVAGVIDEGEALELAAGLVAADLSTDPRLLERIFETPLERGLVGRDELERAVQELERSALHAGDVDLESLALRLEGLTIARAARRVPAQAAASLARRLVAGRPRSHEDLRAHLDAAVEEGELDAGQREALLRNAVDSGDAAIEGGTAPFAYAANGVFTVEAAVSRNQPNGRERARLHAREVVSVAPAGESAHRFDAQRDFEEARGAGARCPGWTSGPELVEAGDPRPARPGRAAPPAGRAAALVAGRPGPGERPGEGFVSPATVRSALPGTEHFDTGAAAGETPRGRSAPLTLPLAGLAPRLDSSQDLLGAFAVEFWFELHDVEAETILFDGGVDEVEDRIVIYVKGRELVLRVDHTGIPDFEARMPAGRAPPGGEIRYAFDDGLELLPGVPYHVAALVGGARDTRLALFVDGAARGRRSTTTSLTRDLPAGASGGDVHVADASGFPERGVLRVGGELMEYVRRGGDSFRVEPAGADDPFGGRGRRGSVPSEHLATELVELSGWTRPLASEPAAPGSGTLAAALDAFTVAELDPAALADPISMEFFPLTGGASVEVVLGTGLTATASTLPLRGSGGALQAGSFQSSGGHALLVCDYGDDAVSGQTMPDPNNPFGTLQLGSQTTGGSLGGAEVIRYTGYDGASLTGVARNVAGIPQATGLCPPSDLLASAQPDLVRGGSTSWSSPREFITTFDPAVLTGIPGLPTTVRVLVIPISVGVLGGELYADYHPAPEGQLGSASALSQIDLDFPSGPGGTEWFRWDTAAQGMLVRDDATQVNAALETIAAAGLWNADATSFGQAELDAVADELDFRGQAGTRDDGHAGGARVLPVHVLGGWEVAFEPQLGVPGRHDGVTLVNPEAAEAAPGLREWHRVNHAVVGDPDWGGYALVGLRDPVQGEFRRTWPYDASGDPTHLAVADLDLEDVFDEKGDVGRRTLEMLNADSRLFTRMLCAPSGEMPSRPVEAFQLNQDHSGRANAAPARIDELRFHAPSTPSPLLPDVGRYVLAADLEFDEDRELRLGVSEIELPHARRRNPVLGADALEVLSELPQAGGLLLVGEEIVGYAGLDPVGTGAVYITQRGLYGSARAAHRRGEAVQPLLFWPAAPLAAALGERGAFLALEDASAFPREGGLLWVGDELVGYTGREVGGLVMPAARGGRGGLLRGRFGTAGVSHDAGTMVRWMPERVRDRALLGEGAPESESLVLEVRAPGAWFTDLALSARLPLPGTGLALRAVADGRASPHDDPGLAPALLALDAEGLPGRADQRLSLPLRRQADALRVSLFATWAPGAFDAAGRASNAWKLAPEIDSLTVGHLQPTLVLEHEEWR